MMWKSQIPQNVWDDSCPCWATQQCGLHISIDIATTPLLDDPEQSASGFAKWLLSLQMLRLV